MSGIFIWHWIWISKKSSKQSQAIIGLSDVLINNFKHAVSDERTISKEEANNSCVPLRPMLPN